MCSADENQFPCGGLNYIHVIDKSNLTEFLCAKPIRNLEGCLGLHQMWMKSSNEDSVYCLCACVVAGKMNKRAH